MKNWIWIAALVGLSLGCSGKSEKPPIASQNNNYGGSVAATTGGKKSTGGSKSGTSVGGGAAGGGANTGGTSSPSAGEASTGGISTQATTSTGGQIGTGGVSTLGGGTAGGAQSDPAPVVRITNMSNVTDPDTSPVLVDKTVDVICEALQSSASGSLPVKPESVTITMTDAKNKTTSTIANATTTANQYTVQFALASVPSGIVTFACTASDKSTPSPITGRSPIVSNFVDHGPSIALVRPANNSAYSAHKTMTVQATIVPVPLMQAGDVGANVAAVDIQVNNAKYKGIKPDPSDSTLYTLDVNFADTNLFPPPIPAQMTVTVTATNSRNVPGAVSNSVSNVIYIDSQAPTIVIASPLDDAVIGGGRRSITFTVIDNPNGSGVKTDTITVSVGSTTSTFVPPPDPTSTWSTPSVNGIPGYSYTFDTANFPSTVSQITVSIQATDFAGNQSDPQTRLLYLDNEAPFVSLDPPNVRVVHHNGSVDNCSVPFDPVGSAATNYQQVITTGGFVRIRAFVWEITNYEPGQSVFFYSGVDKTNVFVYASDSGVPILVGKTGGKSSDPCVAINPDIKTNASAVKSQLAPISISTKAPFSTTDFTVAPNVVGTSSLTGDTYNCATGNTNDGAICNKSSDMSYIMTQPYPGPDSAIYAMNVNSDVAHPLCAGNQWSVASTAAPLLKEGWVCFAAEAADNIGNTGVSAPIPVCLNPSGTANCQLSAMPSCVQNCTPPSRGLYGDDSSGNPLPFPIRYTYTPSGW